MPPDEETSAAGAYGGDMMLSPDQMAAFLGSQVADDVQGSRRVKRKATTNLVKRWPQNTIPYVIDETSSKWKQCYHKKGDYSDGSRAVLRHLFSENSNKHNSE